MSSKGQHYIDVDKALNEQFDKIFSDNARYQAGLFYKPDAKSPELKNLKNLGFSRLTLALIITEVMEYGNPSDRKVVKELYTELEIDSYKNFAKKIIADKTAHVNAHRVIKASEVDEDETYGLDNFSEPDNNRFVPFAVRR